MAYSGNREDLEREALLQELGGPAPQGAAPVSGTMPVGAPLPGPEAPAGAPPAPETGMAAGMAARQALGGYAGKGTMLGFNTGDYGGDAKAANSVKNTFGRIASRYDAKPSSMKAIAADPEFQKFFAGATFDDKDRLHLPPEMLSDWEGGVGGMGGAEGIDVLGSADVGSDSAAGWTWQDPAHDGGGGMGGADPLMGGVDLAGLLGEGEGDASNANMQEILAALKALEEGQDPGREDLLAELAR